MAMGAASILSSRAASVILLSEEIDVARTNTRASDCVNLHRITSTLLTACSAEVSWAEHATLAILQNLRHISPFRGKL